MCYTYSVMKSSCVIPQSECMDHKRLFGVQQLMKKHFRFQARVLQLLNCCHGPEQRPLRIRDLNSVIGDNHHGRSASMVR